MASVSAGGRILYLGSADAAPAADPDLSAGRLRAELRLSLAGFVPRPRRQRGANPEAGTALEPQELHLHRFARHAAGRPAAGW